MSENQEPPSALRILLVEDEQVVAMDMEMQLAAFGYEVTGIAATGKEALLLAQTTRPDLIFMDIQLRGSLDGVATAAALRRITDVPVVFVTAFGSGEAKRVAEAAGSYGFLAKPYRPEDLRAVVSGAVAQHRST